MRTDIGVLSRSEFIDIIERSIPNEMDPAAADELRKVARTATLTIRGRYFRSHFDDPSINCGCPLSLALDPPDHYGEHDTVVGEAKFVRAFDDATGDPLDRTLPKWLVVVDAG